MGKTARKPRRRVEKTRGEEPAPPVAPRDELRAQDRARPHDDPLIDKINPLRHVAKDLT